MRSSKFVLAIYISISLYIFSIRSLDALLSLISDLRNFDEVANLVFIVDKFIFLFTMAHSSRGR
jgi:hypothetical protein